MAAKRKKSQVLTMLRESVLQLCKVSVAFKGKVDIDGIICISAEDEELVIKMHETYKQEDGCTIDTRAADTSTFLDPLTEVLSERSALSTPSPKSTLKASRGCDLTPHRAPAVVIEEEKPDEINIPHSQYTSPKTPQHQYTSPKTSHHQYVSPKREQISPNRQKNSSPPSARKTVTSVLGSGLKLPVYIKEEPKENDEAASKIPFQTEIYGSDSQGSQELSNEEFDLSSSYLQESGGDHNVPMDFSMMEAMFPGFKESRKVLESGKAMKTHVDRSRVPRVEAHAPVLHCMNCSITFSDAHGFKAHNEEVHRTFVCPFCSREYSNRANLERHVRLHTGVKPYMCMVCDQGFTRKDDLKHHMLKHSDLPKPYRCGQCDRNYSQRSVLRLHFRSCHNANLNHLCMQCGIGFEDQDEYTEHTNQHSGHTAVTHSCTKCPYETTLFVTYVEHELSHTLDHLDKSGSSSPSPAEPERELEQTVTQPQPQVHEQESPDLELMEMSCLACNAVFFDKVKFSAHFGQHSDLKDSIFECAMCSEILPSLPALRAHEKEHSEWEDTLNVKKHQEIEPVKPDHMETAQDTAAEAEEPNSDDISEESPTKRARTESPSSVNNDSGSKEYLGSSVSPPARVKASRKGTPTRIRKEPSPSAIELSDDDEDANSGNQVEQMVNISSFGGFPNLTAITAKFDESTAIEAGSEPAEGHPFVVSQPVPSTKSLSSVLSLPSEYVCSTCKLPFTLYEEYEYHLNTNHGKCACIYCGQTFGNRGNRDRHMRLHTGEKPYKCRYCKESFVRGDVLKHHETSTCPLKSSTPHDES